MGCSSSLYHNPEIERKQREMQLQHQQAASHVKQDNHRLMAPKTPMSSRLKRGKVLPEGNGEVHTPIGTTDHSGKQSPTNSNRTELTNKSVKRVAFTNIVIDNNVKEDKREGGLSPSRALSTSPSDRAKAKRQREKNMRRKLLAKMSTAESISDKFLLESERLSLASSLSRATSRTGSPYPGARLHMTANKDEASSTKDSSSSSIENTNKNNSTENPSTDKPSQLDASNKGRLYGEDNSNLTANGHNIIVTASKIASVDIR